VETAEMADKAAASPGQREDAPPTARQLMELTLDAIDNRPEQEQPDALSALSAVLRSAAELATPLAVHAAAVMACVTGVRAYRVSIAAAGLHATQLGGRDAERHMWEKVLECRSAYDAQSTLLDALPEDEEGRAEVLDAPGPRGETAFMMAAAMKQPGTGAGNLAAMRMLMEAGCDATTPRCDMGLTTLWRSLQSRNRLTFAAVLHNDAHGEREGLALGQL